jgi:hypothetical protein
VELDEDKGLEDDKAKEEVNRDMSGFVKAGIDKVM